MLDKDNGTVTDDFIGEAETSIAAGARELTLEATGFRNISRGTMWIKVRHMKYRSSLPVLIVETIG